MSGGGCFENSPPPARQLSDIQILSLPPCSVRACALALCRAHLLSFSACFLSPRSVVPFPFSSPPPPSWSLSEAGSAGVPASASVTRAELQQLAHLSYLPYPADDAKLVHDIQGVIGWLDSITSVDVAGVEPMYTPLEIPHYYLAQAQHQARASTAAEPAPLPSVPSLRLRHDVASTESNAVESALSNAPFADRGFFVVPKVVDAEE